MNNKGQICLFRDWQKRGTITVGGKGQRIKTPILSHLFLQSLSNCISMSRITSN